MTGKSKHKQQDLFGADLMPGEQILWTQQPDPKRWLSGQDVLLIPFTLLWGGFALSWNLSVWGNGAPLSFRLWGLPFLLIGFYMIAGRFFVKVWVKHNTHYAVTDKRLLILTTLFRQRLQTFSLREVPEISKSVGRDGVGSITFGQALAGSFWGRGTLNLTNTGLEAFGHTLPGFYDIDDAQGVYNLINELRYPAA